MLAPPVTFELSPSIALGESESSSVTITDAQFLFHANFTRTGSDLTLTGEDGHKVVVPDYFKHEHLQTLLSPEGAAITGENIQAMVGPQAPGQYAQAGAPAAGPQIIGRVASAAGGTSAVRNGVSVTLNQGDPVYKGDVIQTASDSAIGVVFTDGTTFNLTSNARMILNEFVYNPGGTQNASLFNLVQGSITFLAGEVAHSGDMKVGTPTATMGIRGTAVQVDIDVNNGQVKLSVLVEPGNRVGSFNVYSLSGTLLGTVNNSGLVTLVTPAGPQQATINELQKSPAELALALVAVEQAIQTQAVGAVLNAANPPAPAGPDTPDNPPGAAPGQQGQHHTPGTQFAADQPTIKITGDVTPTEIKIVADVVHTDQPQQPQQPTQATPPVVTPPQLQPGATGGTPALTDNHAPFIVGTTATGATPGGGFLTAVAASYLIANHDLINGLGGPAGFGENTLDRNDDGSTGAINIDSVFGTSGLNFFGNTFHTLFINNNGNITFQNSSGTFTPFQINAGVTPIIAAFLADVDTRGGAVSASPGGHSTGSNLVYFDLDTTNHVMTITWDDVGYFGSHTDLLNAFQLQLIDLGNGDFDILFRYEDINWTTGDASGGSNGVGGTVARAGYSAGDGNSSHFFEFSQSGDQDGMLALESTTGNTNIAGVDVFQVQSGNVTAAPIANGAIQFSDPDAGDTHTAVAQSAGSGYLGAFTVDAVNESGQSVAWHFTLGANEVDSFFDPSAQLRQQFYDVTIRDHAGSSVTERVGLSVATAASDTFVFTPGAGQELVFNFAAQSESHDVIDLEHFGVTDFGHLVLQAINNNHDTLVDLGHGDSVTLVGVQPTQLNASHFQFGLVA